MSNLLKMATVRFTSEGFHCWPAAPPARSYLRAPHRHLFHVEASVELRHNEREIEFHDFLDFCREHFAATDEYFDQSQDFEGKSCETLAEELLKQITLRYEGRSVRVKVFEDGEVGAEILYSL